MEKIAYVYSFETSSWKSCQTITKNLLACYSNIFKNAEQQNFNLNTEQSVYEVYNLAQEIKKFKPTKLIFVDHKPHPIVLLKALNQLISTEIFNEIEFVFHIFGDYTLYSNEWSESGDILHEMKVRFYCASDRQVQLVQSFLNNGESIVKKLPFLVDVSEFYFSQNLREEVRKNFNFSSQDILILYTGRLSLQKNVFQLIEDFESLAKENNQIKLLIAGNFDDLGNPFTGLWFHENEYFQKYLELMDKINQSIKDRIFYLGNLNSESLNKIYNAADFYISLSAHNDEDFGMSPAEAMVCGLPTILTDWAGYYSFYKNDPESCSLVPVHYLEKKIDYDHVQFKKIVTEYIKNIASFSIQRNQIAKKAINYLGIHENTLILNDYLKSEAPIYSGHTEKLEILKNAFSKNPPFLNPETLTYSTQYFKIYECYLPKKF